MVTDTSVISHLFADDAPDKMADSIRLWNECDVIVFAEAFSNALLMYMSMKRAKIVAIPSGS